MGKRFAALLACAFAAALVAAPTAAWAAEYNTLVVGGLELTPTAIDPVVYAKTDADGNLNQAGAWLGDNNVMWDGTTLTLTNATIKQVDGDSITVKDGTRDIFPLTIKLVGNNSCGSISLPALNSMGPLTIARSGAAAASLTITDSDENNSTLGTGGNVTIDGVTLTVEATGTGASGIQSEKGAVSIQNGATVTVSAPGPYAVLGSGGITVTGSGTTLEAISTNNRHALWQSGTRFDSITISDGAKVTATGVVLANGAINVSGQGTSFDATTTSNSTSAVECHDPSDAITIKDGAQVTVAGRFEGTTGIVVSNGSLLKVESVNGGTAITGKGITVENATVEAARINVSPNGITLKPASGGALEMKTGATADALSHWEGSPFEQETRVTGTINERVLIQPHVHAGGSATCISGPICSDCGCEYGSPDPSKHSFTSEPTWSWSSDHAKAEATFTCANDASHTQMLSATVSSPTRTEPTCTTPGMLTYTASVELNGTKYEGTAQEEIPATNHSFTSYSSNGDATCTEDGTETALCDNGCGATDTRVVADSALGHDPETVGAKEPTCTEEGHTGDSICARCKMTLRKGETIPATDHDWGEPAWSWNDDHTEFVATFACANDPAHTEVLTAEPTASVRAEPTCTEPGTMLYRASVELGGERYEATATAEIPATGHAYKDGVCAVCGAEDPDYVPPKRPKPAGGQEEEPAIPATGDAGSLFSAVPALAGATAAAAGAVLRRRR